MSGRTSAKLYYITTDGIILPRMVGVHPNGRGYVLSENVKGKTRNLFILKSTMCIDGESPYSGPFLEPNETITLQYFEQLKKQKIKRAMLSFDPQI